MTIKSKKVSPLVIALIALGIIALFVAGVFIGMRIEKP
jgi:hypothetical protein